MDFKPFSYPAHLDDPEISQQVLAKLSEQDRRVAEDWAVLMKRQEWLMARVVELSELAADHDREIAKWKRLAWLSNIVWSALMGGLAIWKALH